MLKIEMLTVETVGALKPLLLELADYHNQTARNFRGLYPLVCADEKIWTLKRGISAGKTVAAVLAVDHGWKGFCVFRILMSAAVLTIFISGRSCVGRGRERC